MEMGECSAYSGVQANSKFKFAARSLGLRFGGHLALIDFHTEDPIARAINMFCSVTVWISSATPDLLLI